MAGEIKPIISKEAEEQIKNFTASLDGVLATITEINQKKISLNVSNVNEATKAQKQLNDAQTEAEKIAKQLERAKAKLASVQAGEQDELIATRAQLNADVATRRQQAKAVQDGTVKYSEARAELRRLQAQAKELGQTKGILSKEFQEASARANEEAQRLREIDKAVGDNTSSVGNYQQEIERALKSSGVFSGEIQTLKQAFDTFSSTTNAVSKNLTQFTQQQNLANGATTGAVSGLQKFRIALIATGIGAVVVAVSALAVAFFQSQRGLDALTRVLEPLKAIFNSLIGVVEDLSFGIVDAFNNPKQAIEDLIELVTTRFTNAWKAPLVILEGLKNFDLKQVGNGFIQGFTGTENVIDKVGGFLQKNIQLGGEIAENKILLQKLENDLLTKTAERTSEEEKLLEISKDTSKSFAERNKAVDQILKLTEQQIADELEILDIKIANLKIEQSLNDTKRQGNGSIKELKALEAERLATQDKLQKKANEFARVTSGLKKEQEAIVKKQIEDETRRLEAIQAIVRTEAEALEFNLTQKLKELGLNKEINRLTADEQRARAKLIEDYDKALQDLEAKSKVNIVQRIQALAGEKAQLESNIATLQEYQKNASPENQQAINAELELYISKLKGVDEQLTDLGLKVEEFANGSKLVEESVKAQTEAYNALVDAITQAYENGELSAKEFNQALLDAEREYRNASIDNAVATIQRILDEEKLSADERLKLEQDLEKAKADARQKALDDIKAKADEEIKANKAKFDTIKSIANAGFQAITDIGNEVFARNNARIAEELAVEEEAGRVRLEQDAQLLEQGQITQEQFLARKQEAEAELDRKRAEAKIKEAKLERNKALFGIALDTAKAVTASIAASPLTFGLPFSAIALAQGAIQAGIVASRPLPKFAKGVRNFEGGWAMAGEAGPELAKVDGSYYYIDKPYVGYFPTGTDIYNAKETKQMLGDGSVGEIKGLRNDIKRLKLQTNTTIIVKNNSRIDHLLN